MSFNDKPGIPILGGYKLGSSDPMDVRTIADDEIDLQSLIDNDVAYEGLEVYVKSLGKKKVYNGTEFVEVVTGGGGSNVDIYTEGNYLVINTNGTGNGNTGGSGVSGITKNTYEVNPSNISIDLTSYIGGVRFVVNNDNGLSNFMFNNRDNMMKVKIKTKVVVPDVGVTLDYEFSFTKTSTEVLIATSPDVTQIGFIQLHFGGQGSIPQTASANIGLGQIGDYYYSVEDEHFFDFSRVNEFLGEQDGMTFNLVGFTIEAYSL